MFCFKYFFLAGDNSVVSRIHSVLGREMPTLDPNLASKSLFIANLT